MMTVVEHRLYISRSVCFSKGCILDCIERFYLCTGTAEALQKLGGGGQKQKKAREKKRPFQKRAHLPSVFRGPCLCNHLVLTVRLHEC
jgi:hypothetical protein